LFSLIYAEMQKTIAVGISLPKYIISMIDAERGDIPRSRYLFRILEKVYAGTKEVLEH
jgi:hypothetical protein